MLLNVSGAARQVCFRQGSVRVRCVSSQSDLKLHHTGRCPIVLVTGHPYTSLSYARSFPRPDQVCEGVTTDGVQAWHCTDETQWPHVVMLLQVCADQGHVSSSWVHVEIIDLYNSERAPVALISSHSLHSQCGTISRVRSHSCAQLWGNFLKVRGVTPEVSEPWLGLGFSPRSSPGWCNIWAEPSWAAPSQGPSQFTIK